MFGHSGHDEEAFLNPHRNYNSGHPDLSFGAPGLLLTYYLTGYDKAWEAALELADCIEYRLHNEESLCDFFPEGECSGAGYALGGVDGLYAAKKVFRRTLARRRTTSGSSWRRTARPGTAAI